MPFRRDSDIQRDALDELKWDAALDARNLGVTVAEGIVTITGQVGAYAEKGEAERLTETIPGVKEIIDHIDVVTAEAFGDAELGVGVNSALGWAAYLPLGAVSARVEGGWVRLSGTVPSGFQRQNAEDAIRFMKGVKGVTNAITVANRSAPATDMKANIETALRRHFDAEDQHVVVSVDDRVVTLSGTVTNWWQRYMMRNTAWSAPGVENVRDNMRIAD